MNGTRSLALVAALALFGSVLPTAAFAGSSRSGGLTRRAVVTSTARYCAGRSDGPSVPGSLRSVLVSVGHGELRVYFVARRPWRAEAVAASGTLQWEFAEWVPHHRPIFEDNHGGTEFPPGSRVVSGKFVSSRFVYFQAAGRRIFGSYRYSSRSIALSFPLSRIVALGVRLPFTWSASYGAFTCMAVTEA